MPFVKINAQAQYGFDLQFMGQPIENFITLIQCQERKEELLSNGKFTTDDIINNCTAHNPNNYINNQNNITTNEDKSYKLLAPLPGLNNYEVGDSDSCPLGRYFDIVINLFLGIISVIAVVMIISGGLQYMTSELVSSKAAGKNTIMSALGGLLLGLSAWLILNTINPNLLNLCMDNFPKAVITIVDEREVASKMGLNGCGPSTDNNSRCHPDKLSAFDNPEEASAICKGESADGSITKSTLDKGKDGNPFSIGIFQINIIAHGDKIVDGKNEKICKDLFKVDPNPKGKVKNSGNDESLGGCLELYRDTDMCSKYAAWVINKEKYKKCVNYLLNDQNNIKEAKKIYNASGSDWDPWGFYTRNCRSTF